MKSAKTDIMRIQTRSVTVGSAAFAILLSLFQQAAAQDNSYANMLSSTSSMMQNFQNQQNNYNQWLYNQGARSYGNPPKGRASSTAAPIRQYPITATDFRPIFQRMAPDLAANWQPGLTPKQREILKAVANETLTGFEAQNRKNNVATAMNYLFSVSYMVNTGHLLSTAECDSSLMAFNNLLATNVEFITMSPRDKQLMYEQAIVLGGLIGFYNDQGIKQQNPVVQSQARAVSRTALRYLGFNVR